MHHSRESKSKRNTLENILNGYNDLGNCTWVVLPYRNVYAYCETIYSVCYPFFQWKQSRIINCLAVLICN